MMRFEYTIDGKTWNHVQEDFNTLKEVQTFINDNGISDFAKSVKFLTISQVDTFHFTKDGVK